MSLLYATLVFIYGAFLTSFFELVGERLPKGETLMGRSHCDHCERRLSALNLIPLVGYLKQQGRCGGCGQKIHPRYVFFELIGATLFMVGYLFFTFSLAFWVYVIVLSVMLIEVASDLAHLLVLDRVWLIGLVPLIIIRLFEGTILTYLVSSIGLFTLMAIIALLAEKAFKQEALGGGDIKLYLFIGFALPFFEGLLSLFLAALFGTIVGVLGPKRQPMAFVPFIAMGVILSYLYGAVFIAWYLSLLEGSV